jgi:nicotinamidase-related amidase
MRRTRRWNSEWKALKDMEKAHLALLLVDVQRDFWQPLQDAPHVQSFPTNIRTLLATARASHLTIVHTQVVFKADGSDWMLFYGPHGRGQIPCIAGSGGERIEDFAAPRDDEPFIRKQTFDGFVNSELEDLLRARGIKAVLIAGLETSVCVLFTAVSAYLKRFVPLVVRDACADSAEKHEATLRMYAGLCFQMVTTAQVQNDLCSVLNLVERYLPAS